MKDLKMLLEGRVTKDDKFLQEIINLLMEPESLTSVDAVLFIDKEVSGNRKTRRHTNEKWNETRYKRERKGEKKYF